MPAKKTTSDVPESVEKVIDKKYTFNPLIQALQENDKKNLFKTNVTTAFHKTGYPQFDHFFGSVVNVHDKLGRIVSQKPRLGQAAGTFNMFVGASQSGKGGPISQKIPAPVPEGYIRLGDIKIGDKVFTHDGSVTTVDGVFDLGTSDIFKVTLHDGRYVYCTEDHLWDVYIKSHGNDKRMTVDTKTMMSNYKHFEDPGNPARRYRLPALSAPLQYPHRDVPIHPYVIGALIGNGCLTDNYLTILSGNCEVPDRICELTGLDVIYSKTSYNCNFRIPNGERPGGPIMTREFLAPFPELIGSRSHNKKIPEVYMYNDIETRMELLRGLMDTDGSITYAAGWFTVSYSSCSKELLDQINELLQGLGFNANYNLDKRFEKYSNGFHGKLVFQVPHTFKPELFTVSWKLNTALKSFNHGNHRRYEFITVKEIEYSHKELARCIHVTDPSHLYVTEQCIVTHNTTWATQIGANIIRQYKYANCIHFDCEERFDISRCENITRLPAEFFQNNRYMIKTGAVGLDVIQEMVIKTYVNKMRLKDQLLITLDETDEFNNPIKIFEPTVVIIDSITTVLSETFNPDNNKEAADAEKMRSNTEGARDAKTLKGFFKDILPICKEANIIIFAINHININMSMNAFIPVAKQQNYLKQDESIPGGKTMLYYPNNIIKLTAKTSDSFDEESDGFAGHIVMVEPLKSSSNQSGNSSKGISFEMVFAQKYGFDSVRSLILYGRDHGLIEGNKNRLKFKNDDSFTFNWKDLNKEMKEKPIWKNIKSYIIPDLDQYLPYTKLDDTEFDANILNY